METELKALKARLEELDDTPLYEQAEAMGLTALVAASRLPDRQQRRLAVAIVREARRNGLDPLLVAAVIRCESAFDSYAVSPVGAMGLMQVMPATGGWLMARRGEDLRRKHNLFDVELNVELGASYLAEMIRQFGTVERALVAYNAGPGAAKKILASPQSRRKFMAGYPKAVTAEYRRLKARLEEDRARRQASQAMAGEPLPPSGPGASER